MTQRRFACNAFNPLKHIVMKYPQLLSGEEFLKDMVLLVEPMMNQPDNQNSE